MIERERHSNRHMHVHTNGHLIADIKCTVSPTRFMIKKIF